MRKGLIHNANCESALSFWKKEKKQRRKRTASPKMAHFDKGQALYAPNYSVLPPIKPSFFQTTANRCGFAEFYDATC